MTLLDGFEQEDSHIVLIAATNHFDKIDDMRVKRSGRFTYKIEVPELSVEDRKEIIQLVNEIAFRIQILMKNLFRY